MAVFHNTSTVLTLNADNDITKFNEDLGNLVVQKPYAARR